MINIKYNKYDTFSIHLWKLSSISIRDRKKFQTNFDLVQSYRFVK